MELITSVVIPTIITLVIASATDNFPLPPSTLPVPERELILPAAVFATFPRLVIALVKFQIPPTAPIPDLTATIPASPFKELNRPLARPSAKAFCVSFNSR